MLAGSGAEESGNHLERNMKEGWVRNRERAMVRSRYEITYTSLSISLRLLMPFRNVSVQLIF